VGRLTVLAPEGFQNPGSARRGGGLRWFEGSRAREYQIASGFATQQLM